MSNFSDIAGVDQVKEEIAEIVAFLRNPNKYLELGAKSPAGVLLVGAPGECVVMCVCVGGCVWPGQPGYSLGSLQAHVRAR
jgi:ATP-dependent 26S proteasome regulatory subunit